MNLLKYIVLTGVCAISLYSQASLRDTLSTANIKQSIKEEIADLDLNFSVGLLSLDIAEGVGISTKYKYEVEPSYQANYYTRVDRWITKLKLRPGDMLTNQDNLPISLNIEKGAEINFVRQFPSKKIALKALPYSLKKLPLSAKRALRLNTGDFVSIPTKMSVALAASFSNLQSVVRAKASAYMVFSGKFLIHVFKMKDSMVRVKLIAQRNNTNSGSIGAALGFDIFGVSIVDKEIKRWIELDLASFGLSKAKGHQLIVDYIFDLKDEDARTAYNQILGSTYKFKDVGLFSEFIDKKGLADRLITSYEDAEQLSMQDKDKESPRVIRIFKGFNNFDKKTTSTKLGLVFASYNKDTTYLENNISIEDEDNNQKKYFFPTITKTMKTEYDFFILKSKERVIKTIFGLVPLDESDDVDGYSDYGFIYDRNDNFFRVDEYVKFQQLLSDVLPDFIQEKINWREWYSIKSRTRAVAYLQINLRNEAFLKLKGISEKQIRKKLFKFYKKRKMIDLTFVDGFIKRIWKTISTIQREERSDIKKIAKSLHKIFNDTSIDGKERMKTLLDLNKKFVFKKIGLKFIMSLIGDQELDKYVYIKLGLSAKKEEELKFSYGSQEYTSLYNELIHINSVLNDRSYDLRINEPL